MQKHIVLAISVLLGRSLALTSSKLQKTHLSAEQYPSEPEESEWDQEVVRDRDPAPGPSPAPDWAPVKKLQAAMPTWLPPVKKKEAQPSDSVVNNPKTSASSSHAKESWSDADPWGNQLSPADFIAGMESEVKEKLKPSGGVLAAGNIMKGLADAVTGKKGKKFEIAPEDRLTAAKVFDPVQNGLAVPGQDAKSKVQWRPQTVLSPELFAPPTEPPPPPTVTVAPPMQTLAEPVKKPKEGMFDWLKDFGIGTSFESDPWAAPKKAVAVATPPPVPKETPLVLDPYDHPLGVPNEKQEPKLTKQEIEENEKLAARQKRLEEGKGEVKEIEGGEDESDVVHEKKEEKKEGTFGGLFR